MQILFIILAFMALSPSAHAHASAADTVEISVTDAWIKPPLLPGRPGAGFFQLSNTGDEAHLIAVKSPNATRAEIHTHKLSDGVMRMRKVEKLDIPATGQLAFERGGLHLMLFGFDAMGAAGVPVTLIFADGKEVTAIFEVRP